MFNTAQYYAESAEAVAGLLNDTAEERVFITPSQWAEDKRHIPLQLSPQPGPFSFDDTPYWIEVVDNFDPYSPIHFVAVQKGAQVGATVSVLENLVGYLIDYIKTSSCMFATVDESVTLKRFANNIMPMVQHSGLSDLIQSNDALSTRKSGATTKQLEWLGGGILYPFGARSPGKMRSFSVPWLLRDEISGWPLNVSKNGDPLELTETRTNSFEYKRKVLDLSTPLLEGTDAISKRFKMGDQRYYKVPCKHCGEKQILYFRGNPDKKQGRLVWDTDDGFLVPDSVRYVCPYCGGTMINEDKSVIMSGGCWEPTARPVQPDFRSYHLSAMYAPHYARSWSAIAQAWMRAWDDDKNTMRDVESLQVFYNNDLGQPFELKLNRIKPHEVEAHTRSEYASGEVPNEHATQYTGGPIELVTMAVDVQHTWLSVAVMGWSPSADKSGYACYVIDYFDIKGDCKVVDGKPWQALAEIISTRTYICGDREYPLAITGIDASELTDVVYAFCGDWEDNVVPIRGRDVPIKGAQIKQLTPMTSSQGVSYLSVTVDMYKDRWSPILRSQWSGQGSMPRNFFNAPHDLRKGALRELTVEYKRIEKDPDTNKIIRQAWHRPGGSRNELWDVLMYNTALLEYVALQVCEQLCGLEALVWPEFWVMAAADPRKPDNAGVAWDRL